MVMLSDKYRLAYFPVPKAACTTMKRVIYRLENDRPFKMAQHDGKTIQRSFPTQDFTPETCAGLGDHWKFAVIRDPARRIISAYNNKIRPWSNRIAAALDRPERGDALRADGIEPAPSIDAFLLNLHAYRRHFTPIRHHTDPHQVFLGTDLSAFDRIYRIEEMEVLRADLSQRVGREVVLPSANSSSRKDEPTSSAARDALMAFVDAEYDFLSDFYPRTAARPTTTAQGAGAVPLQ